MVKEILKKLIPNKVVQILRLGTKNIYYYYKIKKINKKKKIFIFGTAIHKNLGDHLITYAEKLFLNNNLSDIEIIEIPTEVYQIYSQTLLKVIRNQDLIIINGGGWMGNLWIKEEKLIEDMVSKFQSNKIIIFPQTIYYDKNMPQYNELKNSSKYFFNKHKKLIISVREENSYKFAKKEYNKVILVPDIALYLNDISEKYINVLRDNTIKFCIRNDREKSNYALNFVKNLINKKENIKIKKIDTISVNRISEKKRKKVLYNKLNEFANCKLIITDRLHGMIFSYLVGTPCIILDNKTKKISGVYKKWLSKSDLIFPLFAEKNEDKLENFINCALNNKLDKNKISFNFSLLIEEVQKWQKLKD